MARVPHPLIWPMPSAEILRRMLQLGLSRAIIVYPGDAGAPNSNAQPAGPRAPSRQCRASTHLSACPKKPERRPCTGFRTGFRMGFQLFAGSCLEWFPEHLPTGHLRCGSFGVSASRKAISLASSMCLTIAIQEALNGKAVDWMEKVSDEQYRA